MRNNFSCSGDGLLVNKYIYWYSCCRTFCRWKLTKILLVVLNILYASATFIYIFIIYLNINENGLLRELLTSLQANTGSWILVRTVPTSMQILISATEPLVFLTALFYLNSTYLKNKNRDTLQSAQARHAEKTRVLSLSLGAWGTHTCHHVSHRAVAVGSRQRLSVSLFVSQSATAWPANAERAVSLDSKLGFFAGMCQSLVSQPSSNALAMRAPGSGFTFAPSAAQRSTMSPKAWRSLWQSRLAPLQIPAFRRQHFRSTSRECTSGLFLHQRQSIFHDPAGTSPFRQGDICSLLQAASCVGY